MNLTNFDEGLKQEIADIKKKQQNAILDSYRKEGLSDYAIERKKEQIFLKPEKLERKDAADVKNIHDVKFFFNTEDFEIFKRHFKVLEYQGNNSNSNWLLMGLLGLIDEGEIQYSEATKEIWVVK